MGKKEVIIEGEKESFLVDEDHIHLMIRAFLELKGTVRTATLVDKAHESLNDKQNEELKGWIS